MDDDYEWNELEASLTVGLVNEVQGHKAFVPYAISLFAGPVVSRVEGDIEAGTEHGYIAGFQFFVTPRITVTAAAQDVGGTSLLTGVRLNF
jgi:hypothetical protein